MEEKKSVRREVKISRKKSRKLTSVLPFLQAIDRDLNYLQIWCICADICLYLQITSEMQIYLCRTEVRTLVVHVIGVRL